MDLPYPWLWIAFVAFIFACGLTHVVHVVAAAIGAPLLEWRAPIQVITAIVSIATAAALAVALPQINLLPSPQQQRRALEDAVEQATREKDALLLELNHRVGNQLAKLSAMVRVEMRTGQPADHAALLRVQALLDDMGAEHHRLSEENYSNTHPAHHFLRGPAVQPAAARAGEPSQTAASAPLAARPQQG